MKTLTKLSTALVIAGAALAATPVIAASETYIVDGDHTFPRFSYSHFGLSTQLSQFSNTSGTVVLDQAANKAEVNIEIDMTSVNTGSALFDEHIQDADFLDTAQYPTATFKSSKVHFSDGKPTAIEGDLTIKGITKPVTLTVTNFTKMPHPMVEGKDAIGADAHVTIKRSEFNAGKYAPHVGDEVTISIALEAIQQ